MFTEIVASIIPVWVKLVGVWMLTDGIFSLLVWTKDKKQSWRRDHSIRIIRILFGAAMIAFG